MKERKGQMKIRKKSQEVIWLFIFKISSIMFVLVLFTVKILKHIDHILLAMNTQFLPYILIESSLNR